MRVDSGFSSDDTIATLGRLDVRYTMAVRPNTKRVPDDTWVDIDYTPDAQAQVAECAYTTGTGRRRTTRRLIVRRTRLTDTIQQRSWPDWRQHALLTDLTDDAVTVDRFHRHHAVVELAIRDHALNESMFELARGHRARGMRAYVELQEREFELEEVG